MAVMARPLGLPVLFEADREPEATDDRATLGATIGSRWLFGTREWVCRDPATGAAVWHEMADLDGSDLRYAPINVDLGVTGSYPKPMQHIVREGMKALDYFVSGTTYRNTDGNAAAQINTAAPLAAGEGLELEIPDGNYRCDEAVNPVSDLVVRQRGRATLIRNFDQTGTTGLVMNADMDEPIERLVWHGLRIHVPSPQDKTGNSICLNADHSLLVNPVCDEWSDSGRAMVLFGNWLTIWNPRCWSVHDGGGIRKAGGDYIVTVGGVVGCGDDALPFVPTGGTGAFGFGRDLRYSRFLGTKAFSWNARAMCWGLLHTAETLHMTSSIIDCGYIGVTGDAKRWGTVENEDSAGVIDGWFATDCNVDCLQDTDGTWAAMLIMAAVGSGGIGRGGIRGGSIRNPLLEAIKTTGPVGELVLEGVHLGASRTSGRATAHFADLSRLLSRGNRYAGRGDTGEDVVVVGPGSATSRNVHFREDTVTGIGNGRAGIRFNSAVKGSVENNTFVEEPGNTTAFAVVVASGASEIEVGGQDLSGMSLADPISLPSGNTLNNRVRTEGMLRFNGTLNLRQHQSGITLYSIFTTGGPIVVTLPLGRPGLRFKFIQGATGASATFRVTARSGETVRNGTSVSSSGGYAESAGEGSSLTIECNEQGKWVATSSIGSWTLA